MSSGGALTFPVDLGSNLLLDSPVLSTMIAVDAQPTLSAASTMTVTYPTGSPDTFPPDHHRVRDGVCDPHLTDLRRCVCSTPTFTWTAPNPAPSGTYTYALTVRDGTSGADIWDLFGIPQGTTSVAFNSDNSATLNSLGSAHAYDWVLQVFDSNGNSLAHRRRASPPNKPPDPLTPRGEPL